MNHSGPPVLLSLLLSMAVLWSLSGSKITW
jgi:hypothetical protein